MAYSLDVADCIFNRFDVFSKRKLAGLVFLLTLLCPLKGYGADFPDTYSAEPTHGQVVDQETRKPIPGVVVVAFWMLKGGWHFDITRPLHFMETVTDESGYFRLPAWGPKVRPRGEILTNLDPDIWLFKPGYYPGGLSNPIYADPSEMAKSQIRKWTRNGGVVELKEFDGDLDKYKRLVSFNDHNLRSRMEKLEDKCAWKQIPKAIVTYRSEKLRLIQGGSDIENGRLAAHLAKSYEAKGCDAYDFFMEQLK